jgi:hypothetical protein
MSRLFNVEVFNQSIAGVSSSAPTYVTGAEFNALLGSAEKLKVQVIVDSMAAANTAVTVTFEYNNAVQDNTWATGSATTVAVVAIADLPKSGFMTLSAPTDLAAYGRFRVSANLNATVRIIVCGWSG